MNERLGDVRRAGWSYSGEVWTDGEGRAVVALPPFVRIHRSGFEYEVVPLDSDCRVAIVDEIVDGTFTVATDEPHVKVAWRVTSLQKRPS